MHAASTSARAAARAANGRLRERDARADLVDIRGSQGLSAQPYNKLTSVGRWRVLSVTIIEILIADTGYWPSFNSDTHNAPLKTLRVSTS